jgi:DNA replication protein DnaC
VGYVFVPGRGAKPCGGCFLRRHAERAVERIPARYRSQTLATVKPDAQRHSKQAAVIARLAAEPTASYALHGRNGCGKSLFGWLLVRAAAESGRPAVGLTLSELLAQFRRAELHGEQPVVDAARLRRAEKRWLIFLDEFDKARPSEFAGEQLFNLLDAAYSGHHQIVIASNLTPTALQDHWARASESYGPSIMRRLSDLDDAVEVEMF